MKLGLTLSGGGSRGIAHLGMIKALEEVGMEFSIVSGTSAGAMAGALYAYGYPPDEIYKIIVDTNYLKLIRPAISKTGLLKIDSAEQVFQKYLPEDNFEALNKKLVIVATDLTRGRSVYFSEGELIRPLMASSCIPVVFDPIKMGDNLYVDGGVLNNFPVEPLTGHCDKIVGLHCNPVNKNFHANNFKSVMERTFLLIINSNARERKSKCDLLLEPPELSGFGVFEMAKAKEIFNLGYRYVNQQKERIMEVLEKKGMVE